jgi:hypothetical protein
MDPTKRESHFEFGPNWRDQALPDIRTLRSAYDNAGASRRKAAGCRAEKACHISDSLLHAARTRCDLSMQSETPFDFSPLRAKAENIHDTN